jgi:hypothetical protein
MTFDLLLNRDYGVYLVDCQIRPDRVLAWWVYCDSFLPETVTLTNDQTSGITITIHIPDEVQGIPDALISFYENEPVEFLIYS